MEIKQNKMASMPIPKLVLSMSLPAILAMVIQALYNIVDSIFVAQISEEALTAVSLAFPIQVIIISIVVGLGIGINSAVSRKLGSGDTKGAVNTSEHGYAIGVVVFVFLVLLGLVLPKWFFGWFTSDQVIIDYGTTYITIIMLFSFGRIFAQCGMSTMQGSGDMVTVMWGQLIGAITNLILDPIFIFGLFGLPAMGIKGAAIATITGQILSMVYTVIVLFYGKKSKDIRPNLKDFTWKPEIARQIILVGLPAALMQGLGSVMIAGMNLILAGFTPTAVAVLGSYYKLQSFIFMPIFGLVQGTMPIIGFNFGAKNKDRIVDTIKFTLKIAVSIMIAGTFVFQVFPVQLLRMFSASDEMIEMGIVAFRTISIGFIMAGISITISTFFQAIGDAYVSLINSFIRQIIVLLPCAYILGQKIGLSAVWISFPIAEVVAFIITIIFFIRVYNKKIRNL